MARAEVANVADEGQVQRAKLNEKERQKQRMQDLRDLIATPAGQRFFWWLFETTGITRTTYSSNPHEMASNEGGRNVGLRVLADLTMAQPGAFAEMLQRAATEENKNG